MARPISHGGRDYPDYGISVAANVSAFTMDLSELAVRLGSPNRFDRLGTQLWSETFQYGMQDWLETVGGANSLIELRSDYTDMGPYAVRLYTANLAGSAASIQRRLPYPYVSNLGFEFHVKVLFPGKQFYAYIQLYDGTTLHSAYLVIDSTAKTVGFNTKYSGVVYISLPGLYNGACSPFHVFKIRIDLDNGLWHTLLFNTDEYNISQYYLATVASAIDPHMFIYLSASTVVADGQDLILDNVILTLDEPV